jgi:hypothetical protein
LQPIHPARVPALLFSSLNAAKIEPSSTPRFLCRHARGEIFFHFSLNVILKLFVEFPLDAPAPEERAQS